MHCTHCGKELGEDDVFCTACGTRVKRPEPTEPPEAPLALDPFGPRPRKSLRKRPPLRLFRQNPPLHPT